MSQDIDVEKEVKSFVFSEYANELREFSVFNYLNIINKCKFDESISKIKLHYNKNYNRIETLINPHYFFALSKKERLHVLSTEALKIMLNHHQEIAKIKDKKEAKLKKKAQNIVANNMLLDEYKIEVSDEFKIKLETIENIFTEEQIQKYPIKKGKGSQYYTVMLQRKLAEEQDAEGEDQSSAGNESQEGEGQPGEGSPNEDEDSRKFRRQ